MVNFLSKLIFVTSTLAQSVLNGLCKTYLQNFVTIFENRGETLAVVFDPSLCNKLQVYSLQLKIDSEVTRNLFPDRTFNTSFQFLTHIKPPLVILQNNQIEFKLLEFLKIWSQKQNLALRMNIMTTTDKTILKNRFKALQLNHGYDLFLSTTFALYDDQPKLITYDRSALCVLVPNPVSKSTIQLIFVRPFDGLTWTMMAVSLSLAMIVWKFLGDSQWRLLSAILACMVDQWVEIRHKRLILTLLLQILVFALQLCQSDLN